MTADQDVSAALQGVTQDANSNPTTTPLSWRWVRVRARQIPAALHRLLPFGWTNPAQPASVSAFDALEGAAEQVASRWVDPYGNVINFMQTWVVDWLWKLDGCPTPLSPTRLAQYVTLSNQLNQWPNNYPGISKATFPGEDFATYPAWPPATPVTLDNFLPTTAHPNGSNTAGSL